MNKLLYVWISLVLVISAQSERRPIYFETHVFPLDSSYSICYITFKIPYNNLVFAKNNGKYEAGITLNYEILHNGDIYKRISSSSEIYVDDYNSTLSENDFLEGITSIEVEKGNYRVLPTVALLNTKREIVLNREAIEFDVVPYPKAIAKLVFNGLSNCGEINGKKLINFGNKLPFDTKDYDVILTIFDDDIKNLRGEIHQSDSLISVFNLDKFVVGNIRIDKCDNGLNYSIENGNIEGRTFLLPKVNSGLIEGDATLKIMRDENLYFSYDFKIIWIDKPGILFDIDLATELYSKVTDDYEIEVIYDGPSEEYYNNLFSYWGKMDPVKSTSFNELMFEFYSRADIAHDKFKTADNMSGAKTDRGRIFVKYGEPDEIDRKYNATNYIVEIWIYNNLNKQFYFEDVAGLGNYKLIEDE